MRNVTSFLRPAVISILVVVVIFFALRGGIRHSNVPVSVPNPQLINDDAGLNRAPSHINYSKHARCRMACRHIDEAEVRVILAGGSINYKKSSLDADACHRRYAVEGNTNDGQRVRIIFAPCNDVETVVTVIDLGREWACDCR